MKNKIKTALKFLSLFSFIGIVSISSYFLFWPKIEKQEIQQTYIVSVEGAVRKPGNFTFKIPKTLREILFQAETLSKADLSSIDLEQIIEQDYQIVIPFQVNSINKIKWKELYSSDQLINLGVKKSIANTVIEHRRKNEHTTWEQILALKGIGQITLAQLKELIDLS